jgi:hypothetical protein
MRATTLAYLLTLILVLSVAPGEAAKPDPGLWWEVQLAKDGNHVEITVSTAELAGDRSLTKATCQVAFFGRRGLLGTQLYAFPVPQEAGVEKTETFSHVYGDKVVSVNGPEMKYTLTVAGSDAGTDSEESGSIPARNNP